MSVGEGEAPSWPKVKPASTRDKALEFAKRVPRPSVALPSETASLQVGTAGMSCRLPYSQPDQKHLLLYTGEELLQPIALWHALSQVLSSRDVALEYAKRVPRPSVALPSAAVSVQVGTAGMMLKHALQSCSQQQLLMCTEEKVLQPPALSRVLVQVLSSRDVALEYAKRVPRPSVALPSDATRAPVSITAVSIHSGST